MPAAEPAGGRASRRSLACSADRAPPARPTAGPPPGSVEHEHGAKKRLRQTSGAERSGGAARGGAAAPTDLKIAARPSSGQVRQFPQLANLERLDQVAD